MSLRTTTVTTRQDLLPTGTERISLAIDFRRAAAARVPMFEDIALPADLENAVGVRKLQFQAGRFCAIRALRGLDVHQAAVGRSESGAPIWPSGVVGSITHTDGFVSAAVARTTDVRGLGIDSEHIVSTEQARNVALQVSWPCETAHARQAGLDLLESVTLVFSAKEAVFKCLYPRIGEMFYYRDVRFVGVDAATCTFRTRLVRSLTPEFPADTIVEGRFTLSKSLVHTAAWLAV